MKKFNFILTVILISFALTGVLGFITAQTNPVLALMIELGVEDLTQEADFILAGEVTEIRSEWNETKTRIYSYITLAIKEQIAGQPQVKTITIKQVGGKVGSIRMMVSDSAKFQKGEEVVVFLKPDKVEQAGKIQQVGAGVITKVVGACQGKYTVLKDEVTGKKMVTVGRGTFGTRVGAIATKTGDKIPLEDFIAQIKRIKEEQK